MIRIIGFLVGLGFAGVALISLVAGMGPALSVLSEHGKFVAPTAEHDFYNYPKKAGFQHDGTFGTWDNAQLQRGYQVYREVCASCHSMKFVAYRNLADLGYTEAEVKALAAENQVPGIDLDTGEAIMRPALPTDNFPSPYPNDVAAAAANNNAIPPDLSLMTKARKDGSNYVYSLLTGYDDAATYEKGGKSLSTEYPEFETSAGLYFNPYFKNLNLAMAPPLTTADQVTYADGTEATIDQMAKDVSAFMTWTAEPKLVERKRTGWPVLGFLLFATILAYFSKKQIWAAVKPKKAK